MKVKFFLIIVLIILISFSIFLYINKNKSEKTFVSSPRIVIIGLDGASWNFINPLLKEGKLPNIKKLMNEGSYGTLSTIRPTKSIVIWTSIATGKSPQKHGILNWIFLKNNNFVPYRGNQRKVKTFWNILSEIGFRVGVINWLTTFPPEKVRGFIISDEFRRGKRLNPLKIELTYPKTLYKKLEFAYQKRKNFQRILKEEKLPDYRKWSPEGKNEKKLVSLFPNFVLNEKTIELVSLYLYKKFPVNVFAVYFCLIDIVSHFASGYLDSELLEKGIKEERGRGVSKETLTLINKKFSKIIEPVYSYSDRILGKFLKLSDSNTTFIVISDHGFCFHNGGYGHSDTPEIPHGIILVKGPYIKKHYKIKNAHIYDIVPTILYLLNLPIGKDMDGKVLKEIFKKNFLKERAVKYIDSYEGKIIIENLKQEKILDEKLLEELRALGYIK